MQRILLVLLLFVLLINPPHGGEEAPLKPIALRVDAEPLPRPSARVLQSYGPLTLLGLWRLSSTAAPFGGLSSLLVEKDGRFLGLDDSGEPIAFPLGGSGEGRMAALPRLPWQRGEKRWMQDTESMTRDPATGRIWVGFEGTQRICRYAPGFVLIERCASPAAMQAWPIQGGAESLVRLSDGRFLSLGERANAPDGGYDVLLWAGDPVDPATPPPVHLSYRGPIGYRPTDSVWLGGDRMLVLNRRFTVADWFTARLTLVQLPRLVPGAVLRGRVVAAFQRPGPTDNMEALALGSEGGRPILWIASDDNHLVLQKTLLFKFALPPDWLSDAPAP